MWPTATTSNGNFFLVVDFLLIFKLNSFLFQPFLIIVLFYSYSQHHALFAGKFDNKQSSPKWKYINQLLEWF